MPLELTVEEEIEKWISFCLTSKIQLKKHHLAISTQTLATILLREETGEYLNVESAGFCNIYWPLF